VPNALKDLAEAGVSVWLDDLNRPLIETSGLARMVHDGEIAGITTNPTIFDCKVGRSGAARSGQSIKGGSPKPCLPLMDES
jgi:transaldolase